MTTFLDMQNRLRKELMAAASSTLFDTDRIKELLQDAHIWATELYSWPELEKGRRTTLGASKEYADYPSDFRTDTLTEYIHVNGNSHKRKGWNDFIEFKRKYPNSTKRIFADYGRQIFVFPTYSSDVFLDCWGQIQAAQISADGDKTIFSQHNDLGNEAIVRKGLSVAVKFIDSDLSDKEEKGAITQLTIIWDKIQKRQQYDQPIDKPMFRVPNLFPDNGVAFSPGNFGSDEDLED